MMRQNSWKLIELSLSLSAIETNSYRSSNLIDSPDLSSPAFSSLALSTPSKSLSNSLKARTSSVCSWPRISFFFLS